MSRDAQSYHKRSDRGKSAERIGRLAVALALYEPSFRRRFAAHRSDFKAHGDPDPGAFVGALYLAIRTAVWRWQFRRKISG